ncbi:THAP domain-containing protein 1-like [Linepithema humile]|uniref:THAP domain-containing protein 1-like n=1 Tax=Linepithema humile TaxID=83485 RepID=UPI00351EA56F
MVKNCVVKKCTNTWFPNSNVSYYRFPWSDKDRLDQWLDVVPIKNHISKYSVICSAHFKDSDFQRDRIPRVLNKNAVPSQFDYDVHIEAHSNEKRNFSPPSIPSSTNTLIIDNVIEISSSNVKSSTDLNLMSFSVSPNTPIIGSAKTVNLNESIRLITISNNSEYFPSEEHNYNKQKPTIKNAATQMTNHKKFPTEKEIRMRRIIKILQSRLRRRELKLKYMTQVINLLKKKGKCTETLQLETLVLQKFSNLNDHDYVTNESENNCKTKSNIIFADIVNNVINNNDKSKTRFRYTDKIKEFASTIYFYSPKAYEYLRDILHLPDMSVLRKIKKHHAKQDL